MVAMSKSIAVLLLLLAGAPGCAEEEAAEFDPSGERADGAIDRRITIDAWEDEVIAFECTDTFYCDVEIRVRVLEPGVERMWEELRRQHASFEEGELIGDDGEDINLVTQFFTARLYSLEDGERGFGADEAAVLFMTTVRAEDGGIDYVLETVVENELQPIAEPQVGISSSFASPRQAYELDIAGGDIGDLTFDVSISWR
tara:strand:- start:6874 stop:7473 length:600 start_codon:yes stop_codon:yes gene_type:complete